MKLKQKSENMKLFMKKFKEKLKGKYEIADQQFMEAAVIQA